MRDVIFYLLCFFERMGVECCAVLCGSDGWVGVRGEMAEVVILSWVGLIGWGWVCVSAAAGRR